MWPARLYLAIMLVTLVGLTSCIRLVGVGPPRDEHDADGDSDTDADGDTDGDVDGDIDGGVDGDGDGGVEDGGQTDSSPGDASTDATSSDTLPPICPVDVALSGPEYGETFGTTLTLDTATDFWTFEECGSTGREFVISMPLEGDVNNISLGVTGPGEFQVGFFRARDFSRECVVATRCDSVTESGSIYTPSLPPGLYYFFAETSSPSRAGSVTIGVTRW